MERTANVLPLASRNQFRITTNTIQAQVGAERASGAFTSISVVIEPTHINSLAQS